MFSRTRVLFAATALALAVVASAGCSSDDDGTVDASLLPLDAAATSDAAPSSDAAPADAAANACHALGFGGGVIDLVQVATLPTMTGGTIPLGSYDATAFQMITTTTTGTYRGSWYFETGSTLHILEQVTLSGTPPTPAPRTLSWSTSGADLTRTQTCAGATRFDNTYTVRIEGADTFLDVRAGVLMFTFKKRP